MEREPQFEPEGDNEIENITLDLPEYKRLEEPLDRPDYTAEDLSEMQTRVVEGENFPKGAPKLEITADDIPEETILEHKQEQIEQAQRINKKNSRLLNLWSRIWRK
ncbi:MAG: hypothetical protein AAB590_03410 [Patescibacteria group bacterium]